MKLRRLGRSLALYGVALFACLCALFPVYRIIAMSFMPPADTFAIPPRWLFTPTLESYRELFAGFQGIDVQLYLRNSLAVALGSTVLTLAIATLGAYATARFRFRGSNLVVSAVLVTRMLPPIAMVVPTFLYMYQLGVLDTRSGLIAVYTALNIPFALWMMHGFIKTVPAEMVDAALVDGCTPLSALLRVVLPVVGPGLVAAAAFSFIFAWNDFALAAVLTTSQAKTMPLMILSFQGPEGTFWGPMAAGATLSIAPPVLLMLILQKWMVRGLTMGATKG
jgi:multiple sugar transport system permease protein